MLRLLLVAVLLTGLVAAGAEGAEGAAKRPGKPRLVAFDSCASLVSYARRGARRTGGGTGVPTRAGVPAPDVLVSPVAGGRTGDGPQPATAAPDSDESSSSGSGGGTPAFSGTNVQEAGVDEPDIVKTDGRRIVAVAGARLHALAPEGGAPRLLGGLDLEGYGHQLLVRGDRALVVASTDRGVRLSEIDVSDPSRMAVRRTLDLEGSFVDARLTGGTARIVVASSPRPVAPSRLAATTVRTWVPRTTLRSRLSGRTCRRSVVPCDDVRRPREFSGLDLLTVLTVDLDRGLFSVDRDAILAGAETVYASPTSLYVASRRFTPGDVTGQGAASRTELHAFDTSTPDATTYRGSGTVPGSVLNQYSVSEHEGALRVATTESATRESESFVTVLSAASLARVGGVGGLGRGERIYAVRFVGDRGYVVTFRETDPLYTLDLSDPADPRVRGELKILGFSSYLHPVAEDRLLGVGQDATERGRTKGAQVSLFDVGDPAAPRRLATADLGADSSSDVEFDPRAFLYWAPASLAVLPLTRYDRTGTFAGATGIRVGATTLQESGRLAHPAPREALDPPPIARSLVIGEHVYTLSYAGLGANRLDTLATTGFTAFPAPPPDGPGPRPVASG